MSAQMQIDFAAKRTEAMHAALDHAGERWKDDAFTFLIEFAKSHPVFCGEDVSDAHIAAGKDQPPDLRAWGGLYRAAQKQGYVAHLDNEGWSRRRSSPCPRYRSLVLRAAA